MLDSKSELIASSRIVLSEVAVEVVMKIKLFAYVLIIKDYYATVHSNCVSFDTTSSIIL